MEINGYSEKATPYIAFPVGEVALSQDDPLFVDLTMFPELPTATKVLFPKETPNRFFVVGEVALSQDDPLSVDLTIFPELPTATNTLGFAEEELSDEDEVELSAVLVELLEESFEEEVMSPPPLHEETITAMLTIRTNQDNICFIIFIYRKFCKI